MIIIGEKINATRKRVKQAVVERDGEKLVQLAVSQMEAGADYIDVNVGTGKKVENEVEDMSWLVALLQEQVDRPLALDSGDTAVLRAGLPHHRIGRPFINSITAEPAKLAEIPPLAREYNARLVALAMGPEGIPRDVRGRLRACQKIAEACRDNGIPLGDIYFDPLALPLSTNNSNGRIAIETLKEIKRQFPEANTTIGLSNISYGLPERALINRVFLMLLLPLGLDSAIVDPMDRSLMVSVRTADTILQEDPYCKEYLKAYRKGLLNISCEE